jgi:protein-tyrosine phosphatase
VIDIHCHVLPFVDDGADDWEDALAMARAAADDGIRQCIATPHWTGRAGESDEFNSKLTELRERLATEKIPLRVHAGNEVILVPNLVESLKAGTAFCLGESSYVLLETAQLEHGAYIQQALFQLQSAGYRVILAHPERMTKWHTNLAPLRDLMQRGCYLQMNGTSVLGGFGREVQKAAENLLKRNWVSLLATDAHSPRSRPQILSPAVERVAALIGAEKARAMVVDHPSRVLCNEMLPYIDLDAPEPKRRFWPFGRR